MDKYRLESIKEKEKEKEKENGRRIIGGSENERESERESVREKFLRIGSTCNQMIESNSIVSSLPQLLHFLSTKLYVITL
jgi:hypothetical protein